MTEPLVHVALATFNGMPWLPVQIRSILDQKEVRVHLVISDDGSTDGTVEYLKELARSDERVTLLVPRGGEPGVGANFLYAFSSIAVKTGEYTAFSDQDDLWLPTKLRDQVQSLKESSAHAVSSNVVSFDQEGEITLVRKDQPMVEWDFVFEAPGPGSTFVLDSSATEVVQGYLGEHDWQSVWLHDWFVYALVRAADLPWHIDERPFVAYRQHHSNVLGENRGVDALRRRLGNMTNGRYREQFIVMAKAALTVGADRGRDEEWLSALRRLLAVLQDRSLRGRLSLLPYVSTSRRRVRDGAALMLAGMVGLW